MGLEESTKETKSSGKKPKRTVLGNITCGRERGSSKQEESGPPVHEEENSREQQREELRDSNWENIIISWLKNPKLMVN